jgi:hypothetical protein
MRVTQPPHRTTQAFGQLLLKAPESLPKDPFSFRHNYPPPNLLMPTKLIHMRATWACIKSETLKRQLHRKEERQ